MQFNKGSNVYFLIITFMQMIDMISISGGQPAMAMPLFFVVLVSMVKDAFEDYKRKQADDQENNSNVQLYEPNSKKFIASKWRNMHVGEIVRIKCDDQIPADMLILHTNDEKGSCYVETKNLDGETNLKIKTANKDLQNKFLSEKELNEIDGEVVCEPPNNAIYKFEGTCKVAGIQSTLSLNVDNLLLRGSIMRNTEWAYGLVIFQGHDTKIMRNSA